MSEIIDNNDQETSIDIRGIFMCLLAKWYWFVICGFIGVAVAFFITKSNSVRYKVNSTLLVQEETRGIGMEALFDGMDFGVKTKIQNHIGVIKSYNLISQTLKNLNWSVSWYKSGFFNDINLYKKSPFVVIAEDGVNNPKGIKVHIRPYENDKYKISVSGKIFDKDAYEIIDIDFIREGTFGKLFKSDYFSFTIYKQAPSAENDYYFVFNDINETTLKYQKLLLVGLVDKNADIIKLSLEGTVPLHEVDFLNELVQEYIKFGLKQKNQTSENMVSFIDSQMEGIVDSLKRAGKSFTDFRSKNKTINLSEEAHMVINKVESIETDLFMAEMRADYYKNLKKYMRSASKMKQMVNPSVVGIVDVGLNAMVIRLSELYGKRGVLSTVARDKNPSLIIVDEEIEHLRLSLDENLKNLISNVNLEISTLKDRKDKIGMELSKLPGKEQQLINIKRDFDLNNELYTFLLKKRAEAAITTASNVSDVQIIDRARISTAVRVGPKDMLNLIIGFMLGIGFPLVFFILKDYFNDTIRDIEELENDNRLSVLGSIVHNNSNNELYVYDHPRSTIAESCRSVRTNLQFVFTENNQKVLGVHSMMPDEGKSFVSVNMAIIMAMGGKKVLLVGCDLRKPRLHSVFNLSNDKGISRVLINDNTLSEVIHETNIKNLSVICSGPIPPNPAELLGRKEFKVIIDEVRDLYDYIIIDNAPVSLVTDGVITSSVADANLFVLRQGYSKKDEVKYIVDKSKSGLIPNIKVVLNDVKFGGVYSKYGYYGNGYYDNDHVRRSFWNRIFKSS